MSEQEEPDERTNTERAHAMARHGCGCLSALSPVFFVLVYVLSRFT